MKYSAQYRLNNKMKSELLEAAQSLCGSDTYYPQHGLHRFGASQYGAVPATWEELEEIASGDQVTNNATSTTEHKLLGWTTCRGNRESIMISGDIVIYTREGRRHGIPNFFTGVFKGRVPLFGTIFYDTQCLDASPFAMGLVPNL